MIVLDGARMTDRVGLHGELRQKLSLPDYYGDNLDALNDCLGERPERELVVMENAGEFLASCGEYGLGLLRVLGDNGMQVLLT